MADDPKFSILKLNRYNSAEDCSISVKYGTVFDQVTTNTLQRFKVKESKVRVTAWRNVSAVKSL